MAMTAVRRGGDAAPSQTAEQKNKTSGFSKIKNVPKKAFEKLGSVFAQATEFRKNLNNFALLGRGVCYTTESVAIIRKTGEVTHAAYDAMASNLNTYDAIGLIGTVSYFGGNGFSSDAREAKKKWASICGQFAIGIANITGVMLFVAKHGTLNLGRIAAKIGEKLPFFAPVLKASLSYVCASFVGIAMVFFGLDSAFAIRRHCKEKSQISKEKKAAEKNSDAKAVEWKKKESKVVVKKIKASILKTFGYTCDAASKTVLIAALAFPLGTVGAVLVPVLGAVGVGLSMSGILLENQAKKSYLKLNKEKADHNKGSSKL